MESSFIKMGEHMLVNIRMIKNMDTEFIYGRTVKNMKENGKIMNVMAQLYLQIQKVDREKVYGKTASA